MITYNITTVSGSVTNTSGVLSNLSSGIIRASEPITIYKDKSFEFFAKVQTADSHYSDRIEEIYVFNDCMLLRTGIPNRTWNPCFHVGNDWEQNNTVNYNLGTTYYIRCRYYPTTTSVSNKTYTGGYVYYEVSTDNDNWNTVYYTNLNTYFFGNDSSVTSQTQYLYIGSNGISEYWYGTIDLNKCYVKVNDSFVWKGVTISYENTKIQLRHDIAANWTYVNPILLEGEVGLETDTGKSKVGDGSTAWNSLAYDLASTALQSHQSLANYVTTNTAQTITSVKTFDPNSNAYIKTNQVRSVNDDLIFYTGNSSRCNIGYYGRELRLDGSTTRPQYSTDGSTYNSLALYSDISPEIFKVTYNTTTYAEITAALSANKLPICEYNNRTYYYFRTINEHVFTSTFGTTNDYITVDSSNHWATVASTLANSTLSNVTSISSSSAVQTALDSKANTSLSNLSATGKTVIDGGYVNTNTTIVSEVSVNGSSNLTYTLNLPNDGSKYIVWIAASAVTGSSAGNYLYANVGSDVMSSTPIARANTRASATIATGGTACIVVSSSHKIYLSRSTNWNGTVTLQMIGYRRIGTNS